MSSGWCRKYFRSYRDVNGTNWRGCCEKSKQSPAGEFARMSLAPSRPRLELILGELQDAAELVVHVRDVVLFRVRGDDQQRDAKPEPVVVEILRSHGVKPAARIVPEDEDRGRVPELRFADRVDQRRNPRWSGVRVATRMVGVGAGRRDPGHVAEFSFCDILQKLRRRRENVGIPIRAVAYVVDRLVRAPKPDAMRRMVAANVAAAAAEAAAALHRRSVKRPAQAGRVELVGERRRIPARRLAAVVKLTVRTEDWNLIARTAGTTP